MTAAHVLLGILADGPAHGYDLKRIHDQRLSAQKPLAFGQVYATLARLVRDGQARIESIETGSGPERCVYSITPAGRGELDTWLNSADAPGLPAANETLRQIVTSVHTGADVLAVIDRQRRWRMARVGHLRARRATLSLPIDRLPLEYEIAVLSAEIDWLCNLGTSHRRCVAATPHDVLDAGGTSPEPGGSGEAAPA